MIEDYAEILKRKPNCTYTVNDVIIRYVKSIRYKLFGWVIGKDKDELYTIHNLKSELLKYDLDIQSYYDILILGISNLSERPKCPCGNYTKFNTFSYGYRKFCCRSCKSRYEISESFINAGHISRLGKHCSEEHKKKISESNKGKPKYIMTDTTREKLRQANKGRKITWKDKQSEAALKRIANDPESALKNFKRHNIGKYTPLKSNGKEITYLSSWELKFMKMCDKCKDIISIDTVGAIPYVFEGKDKLYIPDFKLVLDNGIIVVVEIKPYRLINFPKPLAKRIAALKYYRKQGIKYITLTENELFKKIKGSFNIYDYIV